jgi:hypothetical protein
MPDFTTNLPAYLLRGSLGLAGLITSRISTLLTIGGGGDLGGSGAATFIAQAEVAYLGSEVTARAGYLRTLNPVPIFGVYGQDRGYLEAKATLLGRLTLRAFGALDYITYYSASGRNDILATAVAEVAFRFVSFFSASASYTLTWRNSVIAAPGSGYARHEPYLNLILSY